MEAVIRCCYVNLSSDEDDGKQVSPTLVFFRKCLFELHVQGREREGHICCDGRNLVISRNYPLWKPSEATGCSLEADDRTRYDGCPRHLPVLHGRFGNAEKKQNQNRVVGTSLLGKMAERCQKGRLVVMESVHAVYHTLCTLRAMLM